MKKLLALIVLSTAIVGNASAVQLNVLGGLNFAGKSDSGPGYAGLTTKAKGAVSYGATLQFNMLPAIALEVGVFSNGNKRSLSSSGYTFDQDFRTLEIPVLVKFTALPLVDFGAGFYYEKMPSSYNVTNSSDATLIPNGSRTLDTAIYETADYGAKLDVRLKLPLAPLLHALVDASYKFGIKDLDKTSSDKSNTRSYALLAGASIGF